MILVTGASGNVGAYVVAGLTAQKAPFKATVRSKISSQGLSSDRCVELDFDRPETFAPALMGVEKIFLLRPPAIVDVKKGIAPFVERARTAGVKHIVFLSLLGVEKNKIVPHRKIEDLILKSGISYTFLRPSFFMQNISTTHRDEIRELDEILVPAGKGKTSFIDARDIAAVAILALLVPGHQNQAYPLTGAEALTYGEVAKILTEELGREISYRNPSILRFVLFQRRKRAPWTFIGVMIGIYTVAKLGLAGKVTNDLATLLHRKPISFRQFVKDHRSTWDSARS